MTQFNSIKFNGKVKTQQVSSQPNYSVNWALLEQKPDILDLSTKQTPEKKSKVTQVIEKIAQVISIKNKDSILSYKPATVAEAQVNHKNTSQTANDGKIGDFEQGVTGDCWLLAGIKAVANDPQGEKILVNSIKPATDGYNVTFAGAPGKTYHVSNAEIADAKKFVYVDQNRGLGNHKYSKGDDDVKILEIAAKKHFGNIEGGLATDSIKLLTGKEALEAGIHTSNTPINKAYNKLVDSIPANKKEEALKQLKLYYDTRETKTETFENLDNVVSKINNLTAKKNKVAKAYKKANSAAQKEKLMKQYEAIKEEREATFESYKIIKKEANAINDAIKWCNNNIEIREAYVAKNDAAKLIQIAKNDPDEVTMVLSKNSHEYIAKYDKAIDQFIVFDPHNTSVEHGRIYNDKYLLDNYRSIIIAEDIK